MRYPGVTREGRFIWGFKYCPLVAEKQVGKGENQQTAPDFPAGRAVKRASDRLLFHR